MRWRTFPKSAQARKTCIRKRKGANQLRAFVRFPKDAYTSEVKKLPLNALRVYLYLWMNANYEEKQCSEAYGAIVLHEGEILTSYRRIADDIFLDNRMQAKRAVDVLVKNGLVLRKVYQRYTVLTLVKWLYSDEDSRKSVTKPVTSNYDYVTTSDTTSVTTSDTESVTAYSQQNMTDSSSNAFSIGVDSTGIDNMTEYENPEESKCNRGESVTESVTNGEQKVLQNPFTYKNKDIKNKEIKNSEPRKARLLIDSLTTSEEPILTSGYEVTMTSEEEARQAAEEGVSLINSLIGKKYAVSEEDTKKLQDAMSECSATKEEVLKAIQYKFDTSTLEGEIKSLYFSPRMLFPKMGHYVNEMREENQ